MCGGIPTWGMFQVIFKNIKFDNPAVNRCAVRFMRNYYQNQNAYACYLSSSAGGFAKHFERKSCLTEIIRGYRTTPPR